MIPLEVELDVYQGPLDLLLSLILRDEVDLLEVPLCEVIAAYLEERERAGWKNDWDDLTEFLLLMSLLLEAKSRMLLPAEVAEIGTELTPEEAREQLLARLFEYGKFRAASAKLRQLAEANSGAVFRPPADQPKRRLPPLEDIVGLGEPLQLREAMARLLEKKREPDTSHIAHIKVDLRRQIGIIRRILSRHRRFSFERIFGGEQPLVQAVSIFALLELLSKGEIRVSQSVPFGDIMVRVCEAANTAGRAQ